MLQDDKPSSLRKNHLQPDRCVLPKCVGVRMEGKLPYQLDQSSQMRAVSKLFKLGRYQTTLNPDKKRFALIVIPTSKGRLCFLFPYNITSTDNFPSQERPASDLMATEKYFPCYLGTSVPPNLMSGEMKQLLHITYSNNTCFHQSFCVYLMV